MYTGITKSFDQRDGFVDRKTVELVAKEMSKVVLNQINSKPAIRSESKVKKEPHSK